MITEYLNLEKKPVISSDKWHVVHAEWSEGDGTPLFVRAIVSEHDDAEAALRSGRVLKADLVQRMKSRSREAWDQVMVKRPSSETLKDGERLAERKSSR